MICLVNDPAVFVPSLFHLIIRFSISEYSLFSSGLSVFLLKNLLITYDLAIDNAVKISVTHPSCPQVYSIPHNVYMNGLNTRVITKPTATFVMLSSMLCFFDCIFYFLIVVRRGIEPLLGATQHHVFHRTRTDLVPHLTV